MPHNWTSSPCCWQQHTVHSRTYIEWPCTLRHLYTYTYQIHSGTYIAHKLYELQYTLTQEMRNTQHGFRATHLMDGWKQLCRKSSNVNGPGSGLPGGDFEALPRHRLSGPLDCPLLCLAFMYLLCRRAATEACLVRERLSPLAGERAKHPPRKRHAKLSSYWVVGKRVPPRHLCLRCARESRSYEQLFHGWHES